MLRSVSSSNDANENHKSFGYQKMGTLVDPHKREKYNFFELIHVVRKYENIQHNINLLMSDTRVSEFSKLDEIESEDLDIYKLTKKKR